MSALKFTSEQTECEKLEAYRSHYGLNFDIPDSEVKHSVGIINSPPYSLVGHYFSLPSSVQRGTVFLLHGYFDHTGIYGHLIDKCLRLGYAVVIFDLPGHGLSDGETANIDSFKNYTQALNDCLTLAQDQEARKPWFAIGQSTGAAVLIDSILGKELPRQFSFEQIILLAPLFMQSNWQKGEILFTFAKYFVENNRRKFSQNSHDAKFLEFLKTSDELQSRVLPRDWITAMMDYQNRFKLAPVCEQPLHIIQGTGDKTVDWKYNLKAFEEKFPNSISYIIDDARHHMVNESEPFRSKVFSLIDKILVES